MLIWNLVLTAAAAILLFLHFKPGSKKSLDRPAVTDTVRSENATRIAYIDMDSVQENYTYAKLILDDLRKQEQNNNQALERMSNDYNKKLTEFSQQDQAAGLSQLSEAHQVALMEEQKRMGERKQGMEQDYVKNMNQSELNLRNKIKDFLKEYNNDKRYAYIMSLEERMFYYVDTVHNITADVIKGLNESYKARK